jgi:septation ring formation regulator EzrA
MVLISILLIIVLGFYVFSLIIKKIFDRRIKRLNEQMEHFAQDETNDGANSQKNRRINPNIGEYTDFEEVE